MTLGPASPNDILNHIKGLYEKLQSFQIKNLEECHKLFERKLKGLEKFHFESTKDINPYVFYLWKLTLQHFKSVNYNEADSLTDALLSSFPQRNALDADPYYSQNIVHSLKQACEYNSKNIVSSDTESYKIISDNNLGNIFLCKSDFEDALFYFERVLSAVEGKDYLFLKSSVHQNIAEIYFEQNRNEEASAQIQRAIKLKKAIEDSEGIAFCKYLSGKIHFRNKNFTCAAKDFKIAFKILARLNEKNGKTGLAVCSVLLAKSIMKMPSETGKKGSRNFRKAERYFETSLDLAEELNDIFLFLFVYKNYSEFYTRRNSAKAKIFLEKYNRIENGLSQNSISAEINNYKIEAAENRIKISNELNQIYADELAAITKAIRANDKTREDFFRDTIHDLKNPLGNVKQLAEYLIEGIDLTDEDKDDFLQLILESADVSLALVTKLLDNSAIVHAKEINPKPEKFDIVEHMNYIIKFYAIQLRNKKITLKFETTLESGEVTTDKEILTHILDNLISNAIKFSPKGKNIFVRLSKECKFLKIEIKDEGPGFSEEDREKLFKQFSKLSARPTGGEHSSGLGLSIVKKLTDSLHGFITCESEKGSGANMILKIPMSGNK